MIEAVAVDKRIVRVPPALAAGSKFGKYKPEDEKDVRKATVEKDQALEQLKAAWKSHRLEGNYYYEDALQAVRNISYSATDVEKFSLAVAEFQDEGEFSWKAGYFLSALINNGKDTDYVIHTQQLAEGINNLGYKNTKNITVNGNVGSSIGHGMKGGTIIVNGNAGEDVGEGMRSGTITVNGNAGRGVGWLMKGGEIHIEGDFESVYLADDIQDGKIYHKGKLIVGK